MERRPADPPGLRGVLAEMSGQVADRGMASSEVDIPPMPVAAGPRPTASPPPAPTRPAGARGGTVAAAWLLSLALLGGAAFAAWHWRAEVMAAWPPSIRLYAALGLPGSR